MMKEIFWFGLLMRGVSVAVGFWCFDAAASDDARWRTMVFTVLTLSQMGHALAVRASRDSLLRIGLMTNKALVGSVVLTFVLQMAVVYVPSMQDVFRTTPLSAGDLLICLASSTIVFWAVETHKWLKRRSSSKSQFATVHAV